MKNLLPFDYFISELNITKSVSGSGRTKEVDVILDEPTSSKSLSSYIMLKNKLGDQKLDSIDLKGNMSGLNKSTLRILKKNPKIEISINNLKFLKYKLKKKGILSCEYCGKSPLIIYDIFSNKKEGSDYIKYKKFKKEDGATCDHKDPISKGGNRFNYDNLAVCCSRCNTLKGDKSYQDWIDFLSRTDIDNLPNSKFKSILDKIGSNKIFTIVDKSANKSIHFKINKKYLYLDIDSILNKIFNRMGVLLTKIGDNDYNVEIIDNINEGLISLNPLMKDLFGYTKEDVEDLIHEVVDMYDIEMRPCCFEYDPNTGKLEVDRFNEVTHTFTEFPDCELENINGKLVLKIRGVNNPKFGYNVKLWNKNSDTARWRIDRVVEYEKVKKAFDTINQRRLQSLGLKSEILVHTGSPDFNSIAIYKL